jgi:hypothetical protein
MLEGRWKMVILFQLFAHPLLRFSELEARARMVRQTRSGVAGIATSVMPSGASASRIAFITVGVLGE